MVDAPDPSLKGQRFEARLSVLEKKQQDDRAQISDFTLAVQDLKEHITRTAKGSNDFMAGVMEHGKEQAAAIMERLTSLEDCVVKGFEAQEKRDTKQKEVNVTTGRRLDAARRLEARGRERLDKLERTAGRLKGAAPTR